MGSFSLSEQLRLVEVANRAPSVHNVQPARWRFEPGGEIVLTEAVDRRLPIGDPTGHDIRISLGAAFEGLHLALSMRGGALALRELHTSSNGAEAGHDGLRPIARAAAVESDEVDPLAHWIARRRTFRGEFLPARSAEENGLCRLLDAAGDVTAQCGRSAVDEIAELDDRLTLEVLARPEYQRELYEWMRFSSRHPGWARDGLNAECMGLDSLERVAGSWLFRPRVFAVLIRLGLAGTVATNAKKTRGATAVAMFHVPHAEDAFHTGRRLYRLWLEVCRAGFSLCPMSVLADTPSCRAYLQKHWRIPEGRRIVNVLRIGKAPVNAQAASPRLPACELLV